MRRVLRLAVVLACASAGLRPATAQSTARVDFSGRWALDERASENPSDRMVGDPAAAPSAQGGAPPGGGRSDDWTSDLPLEAIGDARRIAIVDEGAALRVTYRSGRKRMFFHDGTERELDDGDGPAKVTVTRSGEKGRRVVVASRWSNGRRLTETWELLDEPRRLSVSGKVSARRSFTYRRVYVPAGEEAEPTPTATPAPVATAAEAGTASAPPVARGTMADCSIRPPRGTDQQELARMAKISSRDAEARAITSIAPLRHSSVISSGVEVDRGCLVFTFDLRLVDKKGVQEVIVDAGDGRILSSELDPRP